ncbi:hypothetical protein HYS95_00800 [Candidatus Daviesbacteria bacterium]|nr:hypothetical protein [Candidatus Daviesbacteria bacterium]
MARVTFNSIFIQHPDGSLEPRQRIRISGIELGPGVRFTRGASFAGIDFTQFIGRDLDIGIGDGGIVIIKGIY